MTALSEMVRGYFDGFGSGSAELPECHAKRSRAYRHGWLNGRDDQIGRPRERADVLRRRAAMIEQVRA